MEEEIQDIVDRSIALNRAGRLGESESLMRAALKQFPSCPEVVLHTAATLLVGSPTESAELAHRAVELDPEDPVVLFRAAHVLFTIGEFQASYDYLVRAQPLMGPGFPLVTDCLHLYGKLALEVGELEKAELALRTAFERAPATAGHGEVLAQLYLDQGRVADAQLVLARAREHLPADERLVALDKQVGRN